MENKHNVKPPPPPCGNETCSQHDLFIYKIDEMGKTLGRIEGLLDDQMEKLFVSNGTPCLAERVKTIEANHANLEVRLSKESEHKQTSRANMIALWIAVTGSFALVAFEIISKKFFP